MKTLDEVIKAIDFCKSGDLSKCKDCPYIGTCELDYAVLSDDALHYLKEYQKIEDEYDELKDWWAEEHAENDPLTWDELKAMEGKPVWVEYNLHLNSKEWQDESKCWDIVEHFGTIGDDPEEVMFTEKDFVFGKDYLGKSWKAYRKELE